MTFTNTSYVLFGSCGAGKNTVMEFFKDAGLVPISVSDLLRTAMQADSPQAEFLRHCGETADIIPDDLIFSVVKPVLETHLTRGFVMESFPYNLSQWSFLKNWMSSLGNLVSKVFFIYLKIDRDTVFQRLAGRLTCSKCFRVYHVKYNPPKREGCCDICNGTLMVRPQDNPATIEKRLGRFENETMPVLAAIQREHYPLLTIDGSRLWTAEEFREELYRQQIQFKFD